MGSSASRSIESIDHTSTKSSPSIISDVLNKPITDCTSQDLLLLMKEFKFDDKENILTDMIKRRDVSGVLFDSLIKPVMEEKQFEIEDERDRLALKLSTRYSISESLMTRFIVSVIIVKIRRDITNASWKNMKITSNPVRTSSTGGFSAAETDVASANFPTLYDVSTVYDQDKLNDWEKQGIKKVKESLEPYYEFLRKNKKKFETCGLRGDLELDAQNMVCKDRFMFNTFCIPILNNEQRRDLDSDPCVQVKLIISEIDGNELYRSILSKVVDTQFGILHTGLLIGEWKFDWYNNSMVSVRREKHIRAGSAISVIDLGELRDTNSILNVFIKISDIVCKYNATMEYSQKKCNCQHFVSDLLSSLSLVTPQSGCFERYFKNLKKGDMSRKFYFGPNLLKNIQNAKEPSIYKNMKSIKFENRKTLDAFCYYIQELGHFKTVEGEDDYKLLKSFDRSFVISGNREGLEVADYTVEGFKKECAFFSQSGQYDDNSIINIKYNVKDLDLEKYYLKR